MLSGGMVGRFHEPSRSNKLIGRVKPLLGAKRRKSRGFLFVTSVWARRSGRRPFGPSLAIGPKQTGYTGPAPSSGLFNQPNGRLSNRYWILAALIRRQGYLSIGGG